MKCSNCRLLTQKEEGSAPTHTGHISPRCSVYIRCSTGDGREPRPSPTPLGEATKANMMCLNFLPTTWVRTLRNSFKLFQGGNCCARRAAFRGLAFFTIGRHNVPMIGLHEAAPPWPMWSSVTPLDSFPGFRIQVALWPNASLFVRYHARSFCLISSDRYQ